MKESRKQFIKEAHAAACSRWKRKIEQEFPKLFNNELEVGKWYNVTGNHKWLLCFQGMKDKTIRGYGFDLENNEWHDELCFDYVFKKYKSEEATENEVEEALIKGARRRGVWNVPVIDVNGIKRNSQEYAVVFALDEFWSSYGLIYRNGKWAKPLNNNAFNTGDWVIMTDDYAGLKKGDVFQVVNQQFPDYDTYYIVNHADMGRVDYHGNHLAPHKKQMRLATKEEVHDALIAEATRRGYKEGVFFRTPNTKHLGVVKGELNTANFWGNKVCVYSKLDKSVFYDSNAGWGTILSKKDISLDEFEASFGKIDTN